MFLDILTLLVCFGMVLFSFSFVTQLVDAVRNDKTFNGLPHAILISACVTFLMCRFMMY